MSSREHRPRIDVLLAVGLSALGVLATLAITAVTYQRVRDDAVEETNARLAAIGHAIDHQVAGYAERLYGLRADFAHNPGLTRDDFGRLVDFDELARRNPGAESMTFDRRRGESLIVEYLEPWDPRSPVLGIDINAEPARRDAADFAQSTGEVAATRPINLIQAGGDRGFLLMLAAYDVSPVPVTAPARRRHFVGVLVAAFSAETVLQQSVDHPAGVSFSVYDAGPTVDRPLRHPRTRDWIAGKAITDYTNHADIDVGSRRWRIVTQEPVPIRLADPIATALIGLALTALAAGLFATLALSRRRAVRLADQMTEDLRANEIQLREAKEEAERANDAKSEFLSRMSHELRTPLTAILGFTELLEMTDVPPDQQRMFIDRTHKAGEHLLMLVNDVLDISRVETGTLTISIEPVALGPVVDDVMELLGSSAAVRTISIHNGTDARHVVLADATRLRQILVNLVSNAIKFNRDGGSVTLASTEEDGEIVITVTDTGRGIAAEDLTRLFQPFDRLGVPTGEVEGTGIGLALSRALAEQMGGSIIAESEFGRGSTFIVRLPRAEATAVPPRQAASPESNAGRAAQVLYIDDDPSNLDLVESAFTLRPGIRTVFAGSGGAGLDMARQNTPDLVLLDLHLPDMAGEEVLAGLRADENTAHIPIVVVSADSTPRRIAALIEAGAFACVIKPLAVRDLLETVDEALASAAHAR